MQFFWGIGKYIAGPLRKLPIKVIAEGNFLDEAA
jgi:hypothetical protein